MILTKKLKALRELAEIYRWPDVQQQYFVAIAASIIAISHGMTIGWLPPPKFILNDFNQINDEISVNYMGAMVGSLFFGFLTALIGSKRAALFLSLPTTVYWLMICFGDMHFHLVARFLGGWIGGGVQSTVLLFIVEIANDDIRGRLSSISTFSQQFGTLIALTLNSAFDHTFTTVICIMIPLAFGIIFVLIPNTPLFYLHTNQNEKAEDALKFYKGYRGRSLREDNAFYKELARLKAITNELEQNKNLKLSDFLNRNSLKGIGIGIALTTFGQCTASISIISFATESFDGTSINPYKTSIVLAAALCFGSFVTIFLADKYGRRKLNLISLMGSACGLLLTSFFYYLNVEGYNISAWMPVASLSFVMFIASVGILPLSLICTIENLPSKIRPIGMSIVICSLSCITFAMSKLYPILLELCGFKKCLAIYSIGCFIGFVFVLYVLEETKGRSLDDVSTDNSTKTHDVEKSTDAQDLEKSNSVSMFIISRNHCVESLR